jgi:hypothetical protein
MTRHITALAAAAALAGTVHAGLIVEVEVTGTVTFNGIGAPPLSGVTAGDSAVMSFTVDAGNFVDGVPGDTRGYVIDQSSFSMVFGGDVSVGLLDPFPAGQTPYFTLVDGFPVSDGFIVSTSPVSPGGVPLSQTPYQAALRLGYVGSTLSSLDILDAVGVYDFTGLTVFSYNLWASFPDNIVLDIEFSQMTISLVPAPATLALLAPLAMIRRRRRRA